MRFVVLKVPNTTKLLPFHKTQFFDGVFSRDLYSIGLAR